MLRTSEVAEDKIMQAPVQGDGFLRLKMHHGLNISQPKRKIDPACVTRGNINPNQ